MRFTLYTLVDITETGARRGEDPKLFKQQQNFLTVLQTIGLRVNPTYISAPVCIQDLPSKYSFGKDYKNKQNIWEYTFDIEYEDALDIETLHKDFDLIPIITGLDESVEFKNAVFSSQNSTNKNIIFQKFDK